MSSNREEIEEYAKRAASDAVHILELCSFLEAPLTQKEAKKIYDDAGALQANLRSLQMELERLHLYNDPVEGMNLWTHMTVLFDLADGIRSALSSEKGGD